MIYIKPPSTVQQTININTQVVKISGTAAP